MAKNGYKQTKEHRDKRIASLCARGVGTSLTKICSICKKELLRSEFRMRSNNPRFSESRCRKCANAASGKSYRKKMKTDAGKKVIIAHNRMTTLRRKGMSQEEYDRLVKEQNNLCAICGGNPVARRTHLDIDHSHKTGKNRGLLCGRCNVALGLFREDVTILIKTIDYLTRYNKI